MNWREQRLESACHECQMTCFWIQLIERFWSQSVSGTHVWGRGYSSITFLVSAFLILCPMDCYDDAVLQNTTTKRIRTLESCGSWMMILSRWALSERTFKSLCVEVHYVNFNHSLKFWRSLSSNLFPSSWSLHITFVQSAQVRISLTRTSGHGDHHLRRGWKAHSQRQVSQSVLSLH